MATSFAKHPVATRVLALFRTGWLFAVLSVVILLYLHAMQKKKKVHLELQEHLNALKLERTLLQEEQEDLHLDIQSQNDPAFIELTLMRKMGVVPEGQVKVYFEKQGEAP